MTADELTLRLLDLGLLESRQRAVVRDVSRRNQGFTVVEPPGRAYFVKQNVDGPAELAHEAAIYRRAAPAIAAHLPRLIRSDRRLLVLELIEGARTLADAAWVRRRFLSSEASRLGPVVASLHECETGGTPRAERPWVFELPAPPAEILTDASAANFELLRIVQRSRRFCRAMDDLRRSWRATRLIHGDLRAANILIRSNGNKRPAIWLIDWESSGRGDPAWDVASVMASWLFFWVASLPFAPGVPLERLVETARIPLERVRPAIAAFWSAYSSARALDARARRAFLLRVMHFAAARLVQHAWESSNGSARLSGEIVCALQASLNILHDPRRAAATIVGERP